RIPYVITIVPHLDSARPIYVKICGRFSHGTEDSSLIPRLAIFFSVLCIGFQIIRISICGRTVVRSFLRYLAACSDFITDLKTTEQDRLGPLADRVGGSGGMLIDIKFAALRKGTSH